MYFGFFFFFWNGSLGELKYFPRKKNIGGCEEIRIHITPLLGLEIGTFSIEGDLAIICHNYEAYNF